MADTLTSELYNKWLDNFSFLRDKLKEEELPHWLATAIAALVTAPVFTVLSVFALAIAAIKYLGAPAAVATMRVMDESKNEVAPELNKVIGAALQDMFGVEFDVSDLPTGATPADAQARAQRVGAKIRGLLEGEFAKSGPLSPEQGQAAADTFIGFSANFAIANAFIAIMGEALTFGQIEAFREIGVELAESLGLGRLSKRGLTELVSVTVGTPYEWFLNEKYRPTLLSPNDVLTALAAGLVAPEDAYKELAIQGFSTAKINTLVELRRKTIGVTDVERLHRWGVWSRGDAVAYLRRRGYSAEDAELALQVEELSRADGRVRDFIGSLEASFADGAFDEPALRSALSRLPVTERERDLILITASSKRETPHRFLTLGQIQDAFIEGVTDLTELGSELLRMGYSADDRTILRILTLLKLKSAEEADALRAERKKKRTPAQPGTAPAQQQQP